MISFACEASERIHIKHQTLNIEHRRIGGLILPSTFFRFLLLFALHANRSGYLSQARRA
jgi:hypothetical protein